MIAGQKPQGETWNAWYATWVETDRDTIVRAKYLRISIHAYRLCLWVRLQTVHSFLYLCTYIFHARSRRKCKRRSRFPPCPLSGSRSIDFPRVFPSAVIDPSLQIRVRKYPILPQGITIRNPRDAFYNGCEGVVLTHKWK